MIKKNKACQERVKEFTYLASNNVADGIHLHLFRGRKEIQIRNFLRRVLVASPDKHTHHVTARIVATVITAVAGIKGPPDGFETLPIEIVIHFQSAKVAHSLPIFFGSGIERREDVDGHAVPRAGRRSRSSGSRSSPGSIAVDDAFETPAVDIQQGREAVVHVAGEAMPAVRGGFCGGMNGGG